MFQSFEVVTQISPSNVLIVQILGGAGFELCKVPAFVDSQWRLIGPTTATDPHAIGPIINH